MLYGFDVGGSKIELAVFDNTLQELWRKRVTTPQSSYQAFLDAFVALTHEADQRFACQGEIGVGLAGMVNCQQKTVYTTNIAVARDRHFVADLEHRLQRNIEINNDANCFALSEAYAADLATCQTVLGVILGTGMGGGIIVNRQIINGLNGCSGEIGHLPLPMTARQIVADDLPLIACGCGLAGCGERYLSGTGFSWLFAHYYQQTLTAPQIIARYYQHDPQAIAHVDRYLSLLAAYLAPILTSLDPDVVVFGGGLSNFQEIYQQLPQRLSQYLMPIMRVAPIKAAQFGDAGGARGAALLCLTQ